MPKYYPYSARLESFAHPQRSKVSPKSKTEYRWPHPVTFCANPESLAHAGFYYSPSSTNPDAVSCFMCNKGLADWDPDDDPAEIHAAKCPACPWAILTCVQDTTKNGRHVSRIFNYSSGSSCCLSFKFSAARIPTSRQMEEARLETFGGDEKWWPHEGKNTGPSSKAMARAGFIYRPADPKDDTCVCLYCGVELAGWDPKDDPM
ncbi:hypothetical protein BU17DRAFT_52205 [Hysterangium stoloniferum]|nr:hypothetical protein BU17DRAFT_52205 [Hysterangium stoloniferum]